MRVSIRGMVAASVPFLLAHSGAGQAVDHLRVESIRAVSGHEEALSKSLMEGLRDFGPKSDNLGNVCDSGERRATSTDCHID
jgi:hypothetical protein